MFYGLCCIASGVMFLFLFSVMTVVGVMVYVSVVCFRRVVVCCMLHADVVVGIYVAGYVAVLRGVVVFVLLGCVVMLCCVC